MPLLTKALVDRLVDEAEDRKVFDNRIPGFGVRVKPSGVATYFVKYRNAAGRQRSVKLGRRGVLSPDDARELAAAVLRRVAGGEDPAESRRALRGAPTVAEVARRYLLEHAELRKRPASVEQDRLNLRNHVLPAFGPRTVAEIVRADVERWHGKLGAERPVAANRALALLSMMMRLAETWGLRPPGSNPCRDVRRFAEHPRERVLTAAELERLGAALARVEADPASRVGPGVVPLIRLLLLTGTRVGELLALRWEDVDMRAGTARLRETKTRPRTLVLTPPAVEVLRGIRARRGCPWVIQGARPDGSCGRPYAAWRAILREAGIPPLVIHDLRHTFGSLGGEEGGSEIVLARLLGHASPATTRRYVHVREDPARRLAERIGERLGAIAGKTSSPPKGD